MYDSYIKQAGGKPDELLDPNYYFGAYTFLILMLTVSVMYMSPALEPDVVIEQRRQRQQNQDIRLRVKLELQEVLTGKKIIASFRLRNGKDESVNLDIPPGVHHGDTMKFPHLGDNTVPGPRGNLFVEIHINHKPNWSRNQNDLKTSIIVNCLELITGTKIKVHTLDNRDIEITIPQGTKNGTTFSVHGHGVPDVHYGQKGKLLITIQASIPQDLKDRELDQIREIIRDNGKL